jgi:type I restriction enzyme S subunit
MYYQKALHRIRPRAGASVRYLMWCLRLGNTRGDYYADGTGSTIPHLPAEKMRAVRIPFACDDLQRQIVQEVDALDGSARAAESSLQATRERLDEYREALITEAVTGQLDVTRVSGSQMDERLHAAAEGVTA